MEKKCKSCGTPYEDGFKFCTVCGASLIGNELADDVNTAGDQSEINAHNERVVKKEVQTEKIYSYSSISGSNSNEANGDNKMNNGGYGNPNTGVNPPKPYEGYTRTVEKVVKKPKRAANANMLVFAVINMVFGCCTLTGIIFGIAAMIFVMMAKSALTDEDAAKYNKIALILNVIGIIAVTLTLGAVIAMGFIDGSVFFG